jgi:hypothetical protein
MLPPTPARVAMAVANTSAVTKSERIACRQLRNGVIFQL